jgi:hypothetical protein
VSEDGRRKKRPSVVEYIGDLLARKKTLELAKSLTR